jgi:hypothetical protein
LIAYTYYPYISTRIDIPQVQVGEGVVCPEHLRHAHAALVAERVLLREGAHTPWREQGGGEEGREGGRGGSELLWKAFNANSMVSSSQQQCNCFVFVCSADSHIQNSTYLYIDTIFCSSIIPYI